MPKKIKPSNEFLLQELIKLHVPESYLASFDLFSVVNKLTCYELIFHEKEEKLPDSLKESNAVLDGFCNPITVLSHSFSLKKIYLVIHRRRWKVSGTDKHFSNTYELHPDGAKITPEMALFFKAFH